jgi:hypothetical protein
MGNPNGTGTQISGTASESITLQVGGRNINLSSGGVALNAPVSIGGNVTTNTLTASGKINAVLGGAAAFNGTPFTPSTSGATGTQGDISWDASYIYICTATNTWKRVLLSTF